METSCCRDVLDAPPPMLRAVPQSRNPDSRALARRMKLLRDLFIRPFIAQAGCNTIGLHLADLVRSLTSPFWDLSRLPVAELPLLSTDLLPWCKGILPFSLSLCSHAHLPPLTRTYGR